MVLSACRCHGLAQARPLLNDRYVPSSLFGEPPSCAIRYDAGPPDQNKTVVTPAKFVFTFVIGFVIITHLVILVVMTQSGLH